MYYTGAGTERLLLRPLTENDIPVWAEFFTNADATRFLQTFGEPDTLSRAAHMIRKQLERYAENRYGLYALLSKDTKQLIGLCGLLLQDVEGTNEIEIGYHLFHRYWGQGYAIEAAKHFRDFAFNNQITDSIISMIDVYNFPSQKVAERNGMTPDTVLNIYNSDHFIYRISREEWEMIK